MPKTDTPGRTFDEQIRHIASARAARESPPEWLQSGDEPLWLHAATEVEAVGLQQAFIDITKLPDCRPMTHEERVNRIQSELDATSART